MEKYSGKILRGENDDGDDVFSAETLHLFFYCFCCCVQSRVSRSSVQKLTLFLPPLSLNKREVLLCLCVQKRRNAKKRK